MKDLIVPSIIFLVCLIGGLYVFVWAVGHQELESPHTQMDRIESKIDRLMHHHNLPAEYTKT